ncbi:hypothetical protein, partial [Streptomyces hainanensis]
MRSSFTFVAAPLLVVAYGLIRLLDGLDGERGPGLAWTTGHLAFLVALFLFLPLLWELRRRAGEGRFATVTAAVAVVGIVCSLVQISVDLVVGALAADHDDMRHRFTGFHNLPGVDLVVYEAGPVLFYLGLVVLVWRLVAAHAVPTWRAVAVTLAVCVAPMNLDLLPVVGLLLLVGLAPFPRRLAP